MKKDYLKHNGICIRNLGTVYVIQLPCHLPFIIQSIVILPQLRVSFWNGGWGRVRLGFRA